MKTSLGLSECCKVVNSLPYYMYCEYFGYAYMYLSYYTVYLICTLHSYIDNDIVIILYYTCVLPPYSMAAMNERISLTRRSWFLDR